MIKKKYGPWVRVNVCSYCKNPTTFELPDYEYDGCCPHCGEFDRDFPQIQKVRIRRRVYHYQSNPFLWLFQPFVHENDYWEYRDYCPMEVSLAESVQHMTSDPRVSACNAAVRRWYKEEISGEELGAARSAAWEEAGAAWAVARDAAWAAAEAAAEAAEGEPSGQPTKKL